MIKADMKKVIRDMELSIVHIAFDAETNCNPPIINYFIFIHNQPNYL